MRIPVTDVLQKSRAHHCKMYWRSSIHFGSAATKPTAQQKSSTMQQSGMETVPKSQRCLEKENASLNKAKVQREHKSKAG